MCISSEKMEVFQSSISQVYTKESGLTQVKQTQYYSRKDKSINDHDPVFEIPTKSTS